MENQLSHNPTVHYIPIYLAVRRGISSDEVGLRKNADRVLWKLDIKGSGQLLVLADIAH